MLRLKKTLEIYKDFRKLFYKIWLESFLNYTFIIVVSLFSLNIAEVNLTLNTFYSNIL